MTDSCREEENNRRKRLSFNVSGFQFETWSDTVERFPTTLLGDFSKLQPHFCFETNQYYFDRNRFAFEAILYFFQSNGRLIRPPEISMEVFEKECTFFELPRYFIDRLREREGHLVGEFDDPLTHRPANWRSKIWNLIEIPDSSTTAFFCSVVSLLAVILWIIANCIRTIPFKLDTASKSWWLYTDVIFSSIFTLEYLTRFATTPHLKKFVFRFINIIDFATSVPYLLLLVTVRHETATLLNFLKLLRTIRIIRFLKLGNSSIRVKLLAKIMASSLNDIALLLLCLMMVVLIGASLLFFTERDIAGTKFTSVPASSWWAIQTVVVLGYGDIVPNSYLGKLFASFFMIFGALTISLPVLSVVTKLVRIYNVEMS